MTALDPLLFEDIRDSNVFTILQTQDVTKDLVYPISYKAYHTNYASNFQVKTTAFTMTVIDPCDAPVSVTASVLTNQEYTITQTTFDYQVPVYTADPLWCEIIYTYGITDISGDAALTFDPLTQIFSFEQLDNLLLSGDVSTNYTVTVTGTAGNDTPTSDDDKFLLMLKNPCIDPLFVSLVAKPLVA